MLKKVLVAFAVLFLWANMASAQSVQYVGMDGLKPLMCGTGVVPLKGTVATDVGSPYKIMKVRFGPFPGTQTVVFTYNPVPTDGTFHNWATTVSVLQGHQYKIQATLENSAGAVIKTALFYYTVAECEIADLDGLLDQVLDAYDRLP